MKVKLASSCNEVFGIELTAENEEEEKALKRFWEGGVKVNGVTFRRDNSSSLQLTFADLMIPLENARRTFSAISL